MSQPEPNILELAKQGNTKAIAALINKQLQAKGITAKASIRDGSLYIVLEALEIPNQETMVTFIHKGIINLKCTIVRKLTIYGKCIDKDFPSWKWEIDLQPADTKRNELFSNDSAYQIKKKHDYLEITNSLDSVELENTCKLNTLEKDNKNTCEKEPQKSNRLQKQIQREVNMGVFTMITVLVMSIIGSLYCTKNRGTFDYLIEETTKSNNLIITQIDDFKNKYDPSKNTPEEGVLKLTNLTKDYKTSFFTNKTGCPNSSSNWLEDEKNREIKAQEEWELSLVRKHEDQDFFGEITIETYITNIHSFQDFIKAASSRIIHEKDCLDIENSKFPLQPIDYSNNKYIYLSKANRDAEIGYVSFVIAQEEGNDIVNHFGGISSIYNMVSEEYIKNEIDNIGNQKKEINSTNLYLKEGYKGCQKLRDIMEISKVSLNEAEKTIAEDNSFFPDISINKREEKRTVAISKLCPQLMK